MKSIPHKKTKKKIIQALSAVFILGIVIAGAYYGNAALHKQSGSPATSPQSGSSDSTTIKKPATPEQQKAGEQQKQTIIDKDQAPNKTPDAISVTITAANQNGNVVNIRSLVSAVSDSGTCTLTITSGASSTTKTSATQALAESSTCKGFDVPTSSLPKGTWHIKLTVTIGASQGSAQKDVIVN